MTIVTFEKKQLEKRIGSLTEKMQDKITMFGTPVDKIDNTTIAIEVFPNRPDLLSFEGFVRSFSTFLGKKNKNKYGVNKSPHKLIIEKLPKEWPCAFACIVKGLKFDDDKIKEVIDMQEKLATTFLRKRKKGGIGLYPLDKIKFPVRFKGLKPEDINFQPLEFPKKINARQILSQHPTGREYAHICQDWSLFPVFIDANQTIMSMPPIINSHTIGKIDENTKDVFIEATGTDPVSLKNAINMMVTALADMGGKIYSLECVQNEKKTIVPDLAFEKKEFTIDFLNKNLGTAFSEKDIKKLLEKMGIDFVKNKNKTFAIVPPYRTDILHQIDLVEEVAIAYGYENFTPLVPKIATIGVEDKTAIIKRKIVETLTGLGILEISTFHLSTKERQFMLMNRDEQQAKKEGIYLAESKTEKEVLRNSLLANAIETLAQNSDASYPQKIAETGTIFFNDPAQETGIGEKEQLAIALCHEKANFTEIKQTLDYLLKMFGKEYTITEATHTSFIDGRCGAIIINNLHAGYIGEIHPQILKANKITMPTAALEMNIDAFKN